MNQPAVSPPSSATPVSVLGAGSWGTALAALAWRRSPTLIWARNPERAHEIAHQQTLEHSLPGVRVPADLKATTDLEEAVAHACADDTQPGLIIIGVPVAGLEQVCQQLARSEEHP